MKVRDPESGELCSLFPTEELNKDLGSHYRKFECVHPRSELRLRRVAGGASQVRRQCLRCGRSVGNAIRQDSDAQYPIHDESLCTKFESEERHDKEQVLIRHLNIQKDREGSHQKRYDEYLKGLEWTSKREKVFARAGGLCEGCGQRPAEDVHHLTYRHIYNEFLFELVAVCRMCHDRIHGSDSLGEGIETVESGFDPVSGESLCASCRWEGGWREHFIECAQFQLPIVSALAKDGPCGPERNGFEPLK
jgi:5-methylcytosine-specific restriction endonuclease McrA